MKKKLLICGSRTITNHSSVFFCLDRLVENEFKDTDLTVISGCANGADQIALTWAQTRGYSTIEVPADWNRHGRSAGYIRNREMLALLPDRVIGFFHKEPTKGTIDMLKISKEQNIKTTFVTIN